MKIVSWNCNGGLRKKYHLLDALHADLLIIQECENPSESTSEYRNWAKDYIWIGENKNKGVGIFARNNNVARPLKWDSSFKVNGLKSTSKTLSWKTSDLRLFVPFVLNNHYTFLACWTKGKPDQVFGYMGQFWKYLQIHRNELTGNNILIIGDFNSNSIWDKPDRWWNHTSTVDELSDIGIESLYHYQFKESQGNETRATFFHQRKIDKPYHIDYAFLSKNLIGSSKIEIGSVIDWLRFSDHMPIIINV